MTENPDNGDESDNSVEEDENDENHHINAIGADYDDEDDDANDEDGDGIVGWIPCPIERFEATLSRSSPRNTSSSSSEPTEPTLEDKLPHFNSYKGRGQFIGVNKAVIIEAKCKREPLKYFMLFFTLAIMETFVISINAYANLFYSRYWTKNVDLSEFKAFLAIILQLGVVKFPNREVAWEDTVHGNRFIRQLMTQDRFNQIIRCYRSDD